MRRFFLPLLFLLFLTGCAVRNSQDVTGEEAAEADLSCSYFYFLWGTHAEYSQRFEEALEAYQKALICDARASAIEKKIPVLLVKLGKLEQAVAWLKEYIALHPDDTSQHLLLAHLSIQQKDRAEAIRLYYEVLAADPDNESILLRLGILHSQQNQHEEAEKIFKGLITKNPEHYLAHLYLARLRLMTDRLTLAEKSYRDALRLNWSPELVYELVDLYLEQGEFEKILTLYTDILTKDPDNERAALGRVQTLLSMERDDDALAELKELRKNSSEKPPLNMAISKILLRQNRIEEAAQLLKQLVNSPLEPEALYLLGLISFQAGENEEAINHLSKITPGSNEYAEGVYLQIRILRKLKARSRAVQLLQTAIEDGDTRHPLFYALLSSLYQEQDQKTQALEILTSGNTAFPENDLLLYEHALLLERSGNHEAAMEIMMQVVEIKEDHAEALNFIGYSWADRNINLDQAYQYIVKAVSLDPQSGYIRDSLGWVQFRLGNLDEARTELLKALELEPGDPHIYDHLGDVYVALRMYEEAREAYLMGLEMFISEEDKARIRQKIDELPSP